MKLFTFPNNWIISLCDGCQKYIDRLKEVISVQITNTLWNRVRDSIDMLEVRNYTVEVYAGTVFTNDSTHIL